MNPGRDQSPNSVIGMNSNKQNKRPGAGVKSLLKRSLASQGSSSTSSPKAPRIAKLIARERMHDLSDFLQSEEGREEAFRFGPSYVDSDGQTLLHQACRVHPPMDVVRELIRGAPGAVLEFDGKRHTPLHVAAAHGASPHVINFLIRMNPTAASLQDTDGKTPLHLYCENCSHPETCDTGDPEAEGLVKGPLLEVVQLLCKAGLQSVNVEDGDDMTPLEYCISNGADVKVVKTLQKASTKAWKMLKEMKLKQMQKQRSFARRPPNMLGATAGLTGQSMSALSSSMSSMGVSASSLPHGGSRRGDMMPVIPAGGAVAPPQEGGSRRGDMMMPVPNGGSRRGDMMMPVPNGGSRRGDMMMPVPNGGSRRGDMMMPVPAGGSRRGDMMMPVPNGEEPTPQSSSSAADDVDEGNDDARREQMQMQQQLTGGSGRRRKGSVFDANALAAALALSSSPEKTAADDGLQRTPDGTMGHVKTGKAAMNSASDRNATSVSARPVRRRLSPARAA